MSETSYESHFKDLLAKGLSTEEEIREARRLLAESASEGNPLTVAEALLRAGAQVAKTQRETAPRAPTSDTDTELIRGSDLEVIERLGRGSQSVVYKCHQITLDRLVAVKILPTSMARNPATRERFFREARHAARLSHPNIVAIHQISPLRDTYYIVMEYVDGGSVAEMLAKRKRFDPAEAVAIVRAAAEGLACAHRGGIIHQDVKPKNLLLTSTGVVKLADLGVATRVDEAEAPAAKTAEPAAPAAETAAAGQSAIGPSGTFGTSGKLQGTPYYMSPEQVTGDPPPDFRTDIYSLGATFYEMLTGRPPFTAATPQEVMRKHVTDPLPDPRRAVPDLPAGVCKILARAMAKEPEDRYPTAEDMIWDLDQLQLDAPIAEEVAPPPTSGQVPLTLPADLRRAGAWLPSAGGPADADLPVAEEATANTAPPGRVAAAIRAAAAQAAAKRSGAQPPTAASGAGKPSADSVNGAAAKTNGTAAKATVAAPPPVPGKSAVAGRPAGAASAPGKPAAAAAAGAAATTARAGAHPPQAGQRAGLAAAVGAGAPASDAAVEEELQPTSSRTTLIVVGILGLLVIGVGAVAAIIMTLGSSDTTPAKPTVATSTVAEVVPTGSAALPHNPPPPPPPPPPVKPTKSKGTPPASKTKPTPTVPVVAPPPPVPTPTPDVIAVGPPPPPVPSPTGSALPWPDLTVLSSGAPMPSGKTLYRIACGAKATYTDELGNKWVPDQMFGNGKTWGHSDSASSHHDLPQNQKLPSKSPTVYTNQQFGQKFTYRLPVTSSKVTVRLHFCETYFIQGGLDQRVFDVKIQGQEVLTNFDIFKEASGGWKPIFKDFKGIAVTAGSPLTIEFITKKNNAAINGIEIFAE